MIAQTLEQTNYNISEKCPSADMSRSTLYRKIKEYQLIKTKIPLLGFLGCMWDSMENNGHPFSRSGVHFIIELLDLLADYPSFTTLARITKGESPPVAVTGQVDTVVISIIVAGSVARRIQSGDHIQFLV